MLVPLVLGSLVGTFAGVVLLTTILVPAALVVALGPVVGLDGILGISVLGLIASFDKGSGGLWLAFTGRYGDERDRGAHLASAVKDGPFFGLLVLGASGLGEIPLLSSVAAIVPFLPRMIVGNQGSV